MGGGIGPTWKNRLAWTALAALIIGTFGITAWRAMTEFAPWVGHDVANSMQYAAAMARGEPLYAQLFNVNPPAIFFVAGLGLRVGETLGVPASLGYFTCVCGLFVFGIWFLSGSLRGHAARWAVLFGYLVVFLAPPRGIDFGQREQIFLLALVPALLGGLADEGRRPGCVPQAFLLGFLGMMKPHFWLMAVVALVAPRHRRAWRSSWPVLASFAIGSIGPFALLAMHAPEALRAYFTEVLPFLASGAYGVYGHVTLASFLTSPLGVAFVILAISAFGVIVARRAALTREATAVLLAVQGLAVAGVIAQGKYWPYHVFLSVDLAMVLLLFVTSPVLPRVATGAAIGAALFFFYTAVVKGKATPISPGAVTDCLPTTQRAMLVSTRIGHLLGRLELARRIDLIDPWQHNLRLAGTRADRSEAAIERVLAEEAILARRIAETAPDFIALSHSVTRLRGFDVEALGLTDYEPLDGPREKACQALFGDETQVLVRRGA